MVYVNAYHNFLTFSTSQAIPSSNPSCVLAEQAVIVQVLVLICSIFSCYKIFLNQNILHLAAGLELNLVYWQKLVRERSLIIFTFISQYFTTKSFSNSSPASETLFVSAESITYTKASVFVK